MPKICPYISGIGEGDAEIIVNCKQLDCEIWDDINNRCGTKVSDLIRTSTNENQDIISYLEDVLGKKSERDENNSFTTYIQDVLGKNEDKELAVNGETILTLVNHKHDSHLHQIVHEVNNIPADGGNPSQIDVDAPPPYAATLINEFVGNQDMDYDGMVYGFDFKIEDGSDKPPMLQGLETQPTWPDPSVTMTWEDYLNYREG